MRLIVLPELLVIWVVLAAAFDCAALYWWIWVVLAAAFDCAALYWWLQ